MQVHTIRIVKWILLCLLLFAWIFLFIQVGVPREPVFYLIALLFLACFHSLFYVMTGRHGKPALAPKGGLLERLLIYIFLLEESVAMYMVAVVIPYLPKSRWMFWCKDVSFEQFMDWLSADVMWNTRISVALRLPIYKVCSIFAIFLVLFLAVVLSMNLEKPGARKFLWIITFALLIITHFLVGSLSMTIT